MKRVILASILGLTAACAQQAVGKDSPTLKEPRTGFVTHASQADTRDGPAKRPPAGVLDLAVYPGPLGNMAAYVTPDPKDGRRHPAIIWITGGDSASIDDVWHQAPAANDQTAAAFRKAGIVTMYPSLRGGNDNPGHREGFYGEVNDVLAAADYLARQPWVDPTRIYLGGHSTGGTLTLLVAEMSPRFRAVFSFGPVEDVRQYGGDYVPAGLTDRMELLLRSPTYWLASIRSPVFVLEGDAKPSNAEPLEEMRKRSTNPLTHFQIIPRATHFSELAPATALIARKILADDGASSSISFSAAELDTLMPRP
jgi:dienelactone hydrolase